MDKTLKIALILTAVDKMSSVIANATNASVRKMQEMQQRSSQYLQQGLAFGTAGAGGFAMLNQARDAFGEMQAASNKLKVSMLQDGGILDNSTFTKLDNFTNAISSRLTGSAADYKDMVAVMQQNGLKANDILGGTGEAVARLAVLFEMAPSSIGQFAARMKQDMGIANNEMMQMTDLVARLHNSGVGKTGEEAVMEMNEAFSKAGIGAANLGLKGIQSAKSLGSLMAIFIRRGISGSTVGTNFRRIFDGLRDGEKLKKANDVAREYGITLDMFDKKGKFISVENFVGQIGKLQGLSPQKIAAILKPFGGRQGLSTDFIEFLAKNGSKSFNELQEKNKNQANIIAKSNVLLSGMNKQAEIAKTSWTNAKAAIGASFAPELTKLYAMLNTVANAVMAFSRANPEVMKFITISIAAISAILSIAGAIKLVQFVMTALKITSMANPWVLAFSLIALAAVWVYTHWKDFQIVFTAIWKGITSFLSATWQFIKNIFLNYTPTGLIIKYWDKIPAFFSGMWGKVKGIFIGIFDWVSGLGFKFFQAGFNIVDNIVNGIKSGVHKVVEVIAGVTQKIRNFLPFSPAKEGALKDIHKIRLVETIAESIKVAPAVQAMRKVGLAIFNTSPNSRPQINSSSGGSNFKIDIHLNGSATAEDAKRVSDAFKKSVLQVMKEEQSRKLRVAF